MKIKLVLGVLMAILAVVVIVIPYFNTCEYAGKLIQLPSGMTMPMKCSYSAAAEIAIGIPLFVVGILMILGRRRETMLALSLLGAVHGVIVILIPTALIGVCSSLMPCNTFMQPFLIAAGSMISITGAAGLLIGLRTKE